MKEKCKVIVSTTGIFVLFVVFVGICSAVSKSIFNAVAERELYTLADCLLPLFHIIIGIAVITFLCFSHMKRYLIKEGNAAEKQKLSISLIAVLLVLGMSEACFGNAVIEQLFPSDNPYRDLSQSLGFHWKKIINLSFLLSVIADCIIGPIYEEMFFRGVLLRRLHTKLSYPAAAVLSSLLFGLYHVSPVNMIYAFLGGLLFSWILYRTKSLRAAMITHCAGNFSVSLNGQLPFFDETHSIPAILVTGILMAAGIYLIHRFTKAGKENSI